MFAISASKSNPTPNVAPDGDDLFLVSVVKRSLILYDGLYFVLCSVI